MTKDKIDILIVDDLKENHLVIESVLTDDGLSIIKASSGEEALELCMTHSFAVILMDVQMPDMDGFETAEILRSIEKTKYTPIIFVTAISKEKASIFKGYEIGAVDYLFKPIDPIILKSKVGIFKDLYKQKELIRRQALELELRVHELTEVQEENDRLETLSLEDPLTQIYNKRGINKIVLMHWKNCIRYTLPISFIMLDLDNFKSYNDHYGHIAGDEVLKIIASILKDIVCRPGDLVGRFGGEEFIIALPNTDNVGAVAVAEKIKSTIYDRNIRNEYNCEFNRVTVSLGIATTCPTSDSEHIELVRSADKAMYIAKNSGRNCLKSKVIENPNKEQHIESVTS